MKCRSLSSPASLAAVANVNRSKNKNKRKQMLITPQKNQKVDTFSSLSSSSEDDDASDGTIKYKHKLIDNEDDLVINYSTDEDNNQKLVVKLPQHKKRKSNELTQPEEREAGEIDPLNPFSIDGLLELSRAAKLIEETRRLGMQNPTTSSSSSSSSSSIMSSSKKLKKSTNQ
jgi:hypothetical protein